MMRTIAKRPIDHVPCGRCAAAAERLMMMTLLVTSPPPPPRLSRRSSCHSQPPYGVRLHSLVTMAEEKGPNLSKEEEEELLQIFNLVDVDRGGSISQEELSQLLETLGMHVSAEELDVMIREIDENSDGEIQFEEFVGVMSKKVNASSSSEDVKRAFKIFQENSPDGYVNIDTIEHALMTYGSDVLSPEKAKMLIHRLQSEVDQKGLFNYVSFVDMMLEE